ncbi:MAG: hypothetical protein ACYCZV_17920 [Acidimicrobiales bacterium]
MIPDSLTGFPLAPWESRRPLGHDRSGRCEKCGDVVGQAGSLLSDLWTVGVGRPKDGFVSWTKSSERHVCYACLLDIRAELGLPLRWRLGIEPGASSIGAEADLAWGRLALEARAWWQPSEQDRPWVELHTARGDPYPFQAWWHVGHPDDPSEDPPRIEIRGCSPGSPGGVSTLGAVATAGWWLLEGFTPYEADRWCRLLGGTDPSRIATRRDWILEAFAGAWPAEPVTKSATDGPVLTEAGERLVSHLATLRFSYESSYRILGGVARHTNLDLDEFLRQLDEWVKWAGQDDDDEWGVPDRAAQWMATCDLLEADRWRHSGVTNLAEAREWRSYAKLQPEQAATWRAAGFDAQAAQWWLKLGFSVDEAQAEQRHAGSETVVDPLDVLRRRFRERPVRRLPARLWTEWRLLQEYGGILGRTRDKWSAWWHG